MNQGAWALCSLSVSSSLLYLRVLRCTCHLQRHFVVLRLSMQIAGVLTRYRSVLHPSLFIAHALASSRSACGVRIAQQYDRWFRLTCLDHSAKQPTTHHLPH